VQGKAARHRRFGVGEKRLAYAGSDRSWPDEYLVENGFGRFDRDETRDIAFMSSDRYDPTPGELQVDTLPQPGEARHDGRTDGRQARAAMPDFGDRVAVCFKRRSQLVGAGFNVLVGQATLRIEALPR
jgi:hypothetical protein